MNLSVLRVAHNSTRNVVMDPFEMDVMLSVFGDIHLFQGDEVVLDLPHLVPHPPEENPLHMPFTEKSRMNLLLLEV